jgi:replicative DNA helicase
MGKSALAQNIAANAAGLGSVVAYLSLDASEKEITMRILAARARVESRRIETARMTREDWKRLTLATGELKSSALFVRDEPMETLESIELEVLNLRDELGPLGLVVVDAVHLLMRQPDDRTTDEEAVARQLKVLARTTPVAVLAVADVTSAVDRRCDKRPLPTDVEPYSLHDASDVVITLYRDEYYTGEESEQQGIAEVIVGKNRHGPMDTVRLAFLGRYTRFADLAAG